MTSGVDIHSEELIYVNGINGSTREYLTPPMAVKELVQYILREKEPEYQDVLQSKESDSEAHLAPVYGIDARDLAEAGWGVIYAASINREKKEALSPLVMLRERQAGALFKEYIYHGESSRKFLIDHDTGLGAAEPEEMPYYLLIVGSPEEIPFNFQYELDVDRAVGRLYFDTAEEYDNYARSVVAAERGEVRLPRRAGFFGVANPDDPATRLSTELLLEPLYQTLTLKLTDEKRPQQWDMRAYLREDATRATLNTLLGGAAQETPAFLLTGSHGMSFDRKDPYQLAHQGALVCQDWDGNPASISEDVYFAGEHIGNDARLHGLVAFLFACYGAGTPTHDEFMRKVEGSAKRIATSAFLSGLPRRMLSHPSGGALAVVGHIERAWTHSFMWAGRASAHRAHFTSTLGRLFDGYPVGYAFDYFNERHASASVQLVSLLEKKRKRIKVNDFELIQTWTINNDARDYIILGDPAVRLCVPETDEQPFNPSTIRLKAIDLSRYRAGAKMAAGTTAGSPKADETRQPKAASISGSADEEPLPPTPAENHSEQIRTALQALGRRLSQAVNDINTVEVLTYLSDDELEDAYDPTTKRFGEQARLKAVTLISMSGDVRSVFSTRNVESLTAEGKPAISVELDERLLQIHQDMVELARADHATLLKNLAELAAALAKSRPR